MKGSSLIIGWTEDTGRLGAQSIDSLERNLGFRTFAEIEPVGFFPLGGITVEDDVAQFPVTRFLWSPDSKLLLLCSASPKSEWYRFLNLLLDIAVRYGGIREVFTIGGMPAIVAHTVPREVYLIPNSEGMEESLQGNTLSDDLNYETPEGQRPTLNSFLLWVAKRRGINGAGLWASIPFYLGSVEDAAACKRTLEFFNKRYGLGMDVGELDERISRQNGLLSELRKDSTKADTCIQRVESNLSLSDEEFEELAVEVAEYLKGFDDDIR